MLKKLGLSHYLAAFAICAILGGWVSLRLLTILISTSQSETDLAEKKVDLIPASLRLQNNLLLIEVDQLSNTQPALQSVWVVFTVPSEPAFITFKRLYPNTAEPDLATSLQQSFLLDIENKPVQAFLQTVTNRLPLDGILIVDQVSLDAFETWIGRQIDDSKSTPENDASTATLIRFCELVNQNSITEDIAWDSLLSDHFVSDVSIGLAVKNWKALTHDGGNHHCEVIQ